MSYLLKDSEMRRIQEVGELGMKTTVTLYRKKVPAKDPLNPYGDDDVLFDNPVTIMGWLVTSPTQQYEVDAAQVQAVATHRLRVPVGTVISSGDKVSIYGVEYAVIDATTEQTWPEWTVAFLRGYEE